MLRIGRRDVAARPHRPGTRQQRGTPLANPDQPTKTEMSEATPHSRAAFAGPRSHDFLIVLSLFGLCTLIYYFGELIDFAGWTALRRQFFFGVHDVHRLFFLAPILYAGHSFRVKGAVIVTVAACIVFLPRALIVSPFPDPILRTVLFTIAAGVMGTFIGVIRNETERRSFLEALVRSEKDRFLSILEKMHDGEIAYIDTEVG